VHHGRSNPHLICHNDLQKVDFDQSAHVSHSVGSDRHESASADTNLERLVAVWSHLPLHIRHAIVTLLNAAQLDNANEQHDAPNRFEEA
jgi:hypothetical protein